MKLFIAGVLFCLNASAASKVPNNEFVMNTQTVATVTGTSALLLAANADRAYLLIQNQGTVDVILKIGSAQSGSEGIILQAGAAYEPAKIPIGSIYAKSTSGSQSVLVLEGR